MMKKEIIRTDRAPAAVGPYSTAVKAGGFLFLSGQIPLDPATGAMVAGPFSAQVRRVLDTIRDVLEASGSGMGRVVKATVFLRDMALFAEFNGIYGEYFKEDPPARSCFAVSGLPKDAPIEIEVIALCD
ncbi:MAG TPA: RidA family protein [Syntrophales bacterium]|nr:RidA family protein [Syntrophales bacterium]